MLIVVVLKLVFGKVVCDGVDMFMFIAILLITASLVVVSFAAAADDAGVGVEIMGVEGSLEGEGIVVTDGTVFALDYIWV